MRRFVLFLPLVLLLAACGGGAASPELTFSPATVPPATPTAAPSAPASPTAAPTTAASGDTVEAKAVGTIGTVLVAGSNGMTVYTFDKDIKDSGKSNCSGGCLTTWPALTVAAGATPTGGTGVTGKLATITRDDGALQVKIGRAHV